MAGGRSGVWQCGLRLSRRFLRLPRTDDVIVRYHFCRTLLPRNWRPRAGASAAAGRRRKHCAGRIPRTNIQIGRRMPLDGSRWRAAGGRWSVVVIHWRTGSQQDSTTLNPAAAAAASGAGWANRLPRADIFRRPASATRRRQNWRRFAAAAAGSATKQNPKTGTRNVDDLLAIADIQPQKKTTTKKLQERA